MVLLSLFIEVCAWGRWPWDDTFQKPFCLHGGQDEFMADDNIQMLAAVTSIWEYSCSSDGLHTGHVEPESARLHMQSGAQSVLWLLLHMLLMGDAAAFRSMDNIRTPGWPKARSWQNLCDADNDSCPIVCCWACQGWMGWLRSSDVADPLSTCSRIKCSLTGSVNQSSCQSIHHSVCQTMQQSSRQRSCCSNICKAVRSNAGIQEELD